MACYYGQVNWPARFLAAKSLRQCQQHTHTPTQKYTYIYRDTYRCTVKCVAVSQCDRRARLRTSLSTLWENQQMFFHFGSLPSPSSLLMPCTAFCSAPLSLYGSWPIAKRQLALQSCCGVSFASLAAASEDSASSSKTTEFCLFYLSFVEVLRASMRYFYILYLIFQYLKLYKIFIGLMP